MNKYYEIKNGNIYEEVENVIVENIVYLNQIGELVDDDSILFEFWDEDDADEKEYISIMKKLTKENLIVKKDNNWYPTELGKKYIEEYEKVYAKFNDDRMKCRVCGTKMDFGDLCDTCEKDPTVWVYYEYKHYDFSKIKYPCCEECGKPMLLYYDNNKYFWACGCSKRKTIKVYKKDIPAKFPVRDYNKEKKTFLWWQKEEERHKRWEKEWAEEAKIKEEAKQERITNRNSEIFDLVMKTLEDSKDRTLTKQLKKKTIVKTEVIQIMDDMDCPEHIKSTDFDDLHNLVKHTRLVQIRRDTGNNLIEEIIERAKVLNNNPDYLFGVNELWLFGSMLNNSNSKYVGDVDITVLHERKCIPANLEFFHFERKFKEKQNSCKRYSMMEYLGFPENECIKFLKSKSKGLTLHYLDTFKSIKSRWGKISPAPKLIFRKNKPYKKWQNKKEHEEKIIQDDDIETRLKRYDI